MKWPDSDIFTSDDSGSGVVLWFEETYPVYVLSSILYPGQKPLGTNWDLVVEGSGGFGVGTGVVRFICLCEWNGGCVREFIIQTIRLNRKSLTAMLTTESVCAHPVRDRAQRSCFCSVTLVPSICSRARSVQSGSPGLHIVQMMTFETRQNPWYDHFWPFAPIKWWFFLLWASVNEYFVNQWTFRVQHPMQWTQVTPS